MDIIEKIGLSFRDGVQKFDDWLSHFTGWITVVMMLTISYDVFMRYVFNAPTRWSFEFNQYFLLACVFLSGAWGLRVGAHVRVDVFYNRLSPAAQAKLEIFLSLLGAIFSGVLAWQGALYVQDGIITGARSSMYMAVLQWPIRLLLVIGAALLCLEFLFNLLHFANLLRQGCKYDLERKEP